MEMNDSWKVWSKGISFGLEAAMVNIPYVLFVHYRQLHLDEMEVMLLVQLLSFKQVEHNDFPSIDQLELRMGTAPGGLSPVIRRLMKEGWLSIDDFMDEAAGIQSERYNLSGMYEKLGKCLAEQRATGRQAEAQASVPAPKEEEQRNLFVIFEKEFARPLSPMEFETISGWVDQDSYPEDLILLALKEAVFAGKVHFRYIDRILLEWSRNRVKTVEDAKAHIQKFRTGSR